MATAQFNDVTLNYEDSGAGVPVVFIHGALIGDAFVSLRAEPSLNNRFRLVTYHRRGYLGSSQAHAGLSVADQAGDCLALMRGLGIGSAHIVGHSFGGVVALQLARGSPEAVQSLALLEPALMIGSSAEAYRESLSAGIDHFREVGARTAVDEMLTARWPQYKSRLPALLPNGFDDAVAAAPASFEAELPSLFGWHFTEDDALRIEHPTLSVLGGESHTLSPRFEEVHGWLLTHVLHVNGFVLPRAHHFLQMENSCDMAEALASFWTSPPR